MGGERQLWGKAEVHLHIVLTWPGEKVWISWNWYFPRACAMCIYCTLDHSLRAVAVIFVLIRSGLFVSFNSVSGNWIEREKRSESWAYRKWRQYKTCSLSFCLAWSEKENISRILGVVFGQMVWSASIMCSKVDVLLCRWCTHEWKKPMRSLKAWCKTRILTWGKVACIQ